ncbi:hypothetical protein Bca4012_042625 [Brassica carinata]
MPMLLEVFSEEDSYEDEEANDNHITSLSQFVSGTFLLHKAAVLESFHLNIASECSGSQIGLWELNRVILLDVPSQFTFSSLVKLRLLSVIYSDDESFSRLISNCPVLEELAVETCPQDNVVTFTADLASLKSLSIGNTVRENPPNDHLFVIHSHSLKRLSIVDYFGELDLIGNLPKLVEANLQSMSYHANVLESFTFVKRLYVCLADKARYPHGTVLFQLVCLELCSCDDSWTSMLVSLLHHSPKLQALKLVQDHGMPAERKVRWIQPTHVPECLLLHLKRFEWRDYEGTKVEKEVAIYILNNAKRLVSATIYPFSVSLVRKRKMFEEVEIATTSLRAFKLVRKHQIFEEFEILQPEGQKHMGAYNEKLIVQES